MTNELYKQSKSTIIILCILVFVLLLPLCIGLALWANGVLLNNLFDNLIQYIFLKFIQ